MRMSVPKSPQRKITMNDFKKKIDNDWKRKAAAEKKALQAKATQSEQKGDQESDAPEFMDLVKTLAVQVQMALGAPDPNTGQRRANPEAAQYAIGLLEVLAEKTQGNLEAQEAEDLSRLVGELKTVYARVMGS
jgi:hypothetical protein